MTHPTFSSTHPPVSEWRIRLGTVVWFVLGLGFLLSLPILLDWADWVVGVIVACGAVLAVPCAWVLRLVSATSRQRSFAQSWLRAGFACLFALSIVVAAPIYYFATIAELRPAVIPQVTLTNGHKTVVFQGMMHVGAENFYKAVIYDVERALADGYVIYYEGVGAKTPEAKAFFTKLTSALTGGGTDLSGSYRDLGEVCGLKFQQDYFGLLQADKKEHPERHVIADVDGLDMEQEYERLMRSDPEFAKAHADDFQEKATSTNKPNSMLGLIGWLKTGSESQKRLAGVVCRGLMTRAVVPKNTKTPGHFDAIIVDFRNRMLAKRIADETSDKIFLTYGADHLPGLFALLRQQDPAWKVVSVKWLRTIEAPEHLQGQLRLPGAS